MRIVGMAVIEGVRKSHDGNIWDSGLILDHASGKLCRVRLDILDQGRSLQVRGGLSGAVFRTQVWHRVP